MTGFSIKTSKMVKKYENAYKRGIPVDKMPNSRRVNLKSKYLRMERNDKTICSKACILFKYRNDYLLIELDDKTCRAVRAWRSAPTGIFPMHTQYLALEAFHTKLVGFETVYANNLEPLRFSFTENMPSIVPIYHYDVAYVINLLSKSRGYHNSGAAASNDSLPSFTSNNSSMTAVQQQQQLFSDCLYTAPKRPKLDYNFYKSMDPSITYKDYLKIVS